MVGKDLGIDMSKFPKGWDFQTCEELGPLCPVEATTYGYLPNLAGNAIFAGCFAVTAIITLWIGCKKKTWSFSILVFIACFMEFIGYTGRILMRDNPWKQMYMMIQLSCIIIAPTLYCAAIYLTLKHMALGVGAHISRMKPVLYTPIFLCGDIACLIIQSAGGGIASTADSDIVKAKLGEDLMIAGVSLQVSVLTIFGGFFVDFWLRARRYYRQPTRQTEQGYLLWTDKHFRMFIGGMMAAYICIWIRCVYRIAELCLGWGNKIMRDEISFMILEGSFIVIAAWLLTIFAPGIHFPQMGSGHMKNVTLLEGQSNVELTSRDMSEEEYIPKPRQNRSRRR